MFQDHRERCRRVSMTWTDMCVLKFLQRDELIHTLKTMEGLLHLVPPRTQRNSWYGNFCTCGLCYMVFLLYVI